MKVSFVSTHIEEQTFFFVLQLKDCFGFGGYFWLSVVKHLVSSMGHIAHALQHLFIGFVNACKFSVNTVYG